MCPPCEDQEGGPVNMVWKKRPASLSFALDPISIKLFLLFSASVSLSVKCELRTGSGVSSQSHLLTDLGQVI